MTSLNDDGKPKNLADRELIGSSQMGSEARKRYVNEALSLWVSCHNPPLFAHTTSDPCNLSKVPRADTVKDVISRMKLRGGLL